MHMRQGVAPRKAGERDVCGVRCRCEAGSGTPEMGKISCYRGEMLSEGMVVHPGNREKRRIPG